MRESFHSMRYPLAIDAGMGEVADETDYGKHVEQLILQVLLTNPGERINRPDFGCGLRRMVFAPNSDAAATLLKATVLSALAKWLPSVIKVEDVVITTEAETLSVQLRYVLLVRQERRYLNVSVEVSP